MTTKRERILLAIGTSQATIPGITGVYRSRDDALAREEAPAIVIGWKNDEPRGTGVVGFTDKNLTVTIGVYTRGDTPDLLADPICEQVYSRMMGDPTLGGLVIDIDDVGASNDTDAADAHAGWIEMTFRVWYRHIRESIAQSENVPDGALSIAEGWLMLSGGYLTAARQSGAPNGSLKLSDGYLQQSGGYLTAS